MLSPNHANHTACGTAGHPSIPTLYAWGENKYCQFMAMQRLGGSLRDVFIAGEERLTMRNLGAIAVRLVSAT